MNISYIILKHVIWRFQIYNLFREIFREDKSNNVFRKILKFFRKTSCSIYHEPLRTWIKTNVNKFAIWTHTAFKSDKQALRSYLKLTCEYELHILPTTKVSAAKDHGKYYMKVGPPLVRHR